MSFDYLKNNRQLTIIALIGVSVVLAVAALAKVRGFFVTSARAQSLVKKAVAGEKADPNDVQVYLADAKAIADALKKKNVFAPPEPRRHPVSEVSGILGNEAFINGKWYKAGDKIGDATVVAIDPTIVKIEWDGKEKVFAPIAAAIVGGPAKKKSKQPVAEKKAGRSDVVAKPVQGKVMTAPAEEDVLAWIGVKLSDKLRSKFLEKWNGLSEEEKAEAKTKWKSMSGEQKKQVVEGMERRM